MPLAAHRLARSHLCLACKIFLRLPQLGTPQWPRFFAPDLIRLLLARSTSTTQALSMVPTPATSWPTTWLPPLCRLGYLRQSHARRAPRLRHPAWTPWRTIPHRAALPRVLCNLPAAGRRTLVRAGPMRPRLRHQRLLAFSATLNTTRASSMESTPRTSRPPTWRPMLRRPGKQPDRTQGHRTWALTASRCPRF